MRLLHPDSSALGAASVSRQLTAEIVARQRALHPDIQVTYRDLGADPALHLTGAHMAIRAGAYAAGTPAAANEHQESYLIGLLSFLGSD